MAAFRTTSSDHSVLGVHGGQASEVVERLAAVAWAWHSFGSYWVSAGVPLRLRVLVYKAVVVSSLLTGLETTVLRGGQLRRLESWNAKHLRVLLQGSVRSL